MTTEKEIFDASPVETSRDTASTARKKKVLYYSVHEVLEYDDLRILKNAGYDVFSLGSYYSPTALSNRFRTSKTGFSNQDDFEVALAGGAFWDNQGRPTFTADFIDRFDITIINFDPSVISNNIEALARRPLVFRTLGQTTLAIEEHLRPYADRLIVCRYDEREGHPSYLKTDAVIRFGKYLDEFPAWSGSEEYLLTFMNIIKRPQARPIYDDYCRIVAGHTARVYGMENEGVDNYVGFASQDEQLLLYQGCRAYLFVNSLVASYTLNLMEAMIVGAPIIAPSAAFTMTPGYADWWPERYAVEELLSDGAGLIYNSVDEARNLIASLSDRDLKTLSRCARQRAHTLFDAHQIEREWRAFIERHT